MLESLTLAHVSVSRPFISEAPKSRPLILADIAASRYRGIRTAAMTLMMTSVAMSSIRVNPVSPVSDVFEANPNRPLRYQLKRIS